MGRLRRGQVFEVAFWLAFAGVAYALSFDFDRDLEVYRFGAAGWPRAVVAGIVVAALCQLWQDLRGAPEVDGAAGPADGAAESTAGLRLAVILLLPLAYAFLLDTSGFYVTTPLFLAAFLFAGGERRPRWLIAVPLGTWIVMVLIFTQLFYVGLPTGYASPFYELSSWLLDLLR